MSCLRMSCLVHNRACDECRLMLTRFEWRRCKTVKSWGRWHLLVSRYSPFCWIIICLHCLPATNTSHQSATRHALWSFTKKKKQTIETTVDSAIVINEISWRTGKDFNEFYTTVCLVCKGDVIFRCAKVQSKERIFIAARDIMCTGWA